jgi:exosortase D (VPLPA-CTERM-specific)
MSVQSIRTPQTSTFYFVLVGLLAILVAFSGTLLETGIWWADHEEYSHGFLIPIVSAWLLWMRRDALRANTGQPTWAGPVIVLLAAAMHITGELSATIILSQLGFVLAIVGLVVGVGGYSLLRTAFVPILFLLFAIPLPRFIENMMSLQLQLVSSQLGASSIRMLQIPVYLDGNIIDLGNYKVQVVEACSGLRYIYPLLSLSFLAAYFFKAPLWQRAIVFLSAIPVTIVLNGLRIGFVGVTVNYFGPQAADGILHLFEGWIVFLACAAILALVIYFLARIFGRSFSEAVYFPNVEFSITHRQEINSRHQVPLFASLLLLCVAGLAASQHSGRAEIIPDRPRFIAFPEQIGSWNGHASLLDPEIERALRLDDYILSDYKRADGKAVNLYVAYYSSQRKSEQPHSPSDCMPASGWQMSNFERTNYTDNGTKWPLNRVVIEKNSTKQLVYYWFDERGRKIANEYLAKWYLHADAIFMNRTDGALVRLITQIHAGETEQDADERLRSFIRIVTPSLSKYLPSDAALNVRSVVNKREDTQL